MIRYHLLLTLLLLVAGCAGVQIVPQPQFDNQLDPETATLSQTHNAVTVAVRSAELTVRPAAIESNFCSFHVKVSNQSGRSLPITHADFLLITADGQQINSISADNLMQLLTPQIPYLIPSPYVGYYYLGDQARGSAADQFRSESAYVTSRRPEEIGLNALPEAVLNPAANISGLIYFPADLSSLQSFEIIYQSQSAEGADSYEFRYRFSVEKN